MKPERTPYLHEISTKEELDFLIKWLRVLFDTYPDAQGRINSISIKLTGKFIGVDQAGAVSVEKVEE